MIDRFYSIIRMKNVTSGMVEIIEITIFSIVSQPDGLKPPVNTREDHVVRTELGQRYLFGSTKASGKCRSGSDSKGHDAPHAPYLVSISQPEIRKIQSSEIGRKTFQPSRISWS